MQFAIQTGKRVSLGKRRGLLDLVSVSDGKSTDSHNLLCILYTNINHVKSLLFI